MTWHIRRPRSIARKRVAALAALLVIAGGVACSAISSSIQHEAPAAPTALQPATSIAGNPAGAPGNGAGAPVGGVPASSNLAAAPQAAVPGSSSLSAAPVAANLGGA